MIGRIIEILAMSLLLTSTACRSLPVQPAYDNAAVAADHPLASKAGVEMHCDLRALSILGHSQTLNLKPATEVDWGMEFLSLTAAVKVVDSLEEALEHIAKYGSGHSEAIVTEAIVTWVPASPAPRASNRGLGLSP